MQANKACTADLAVGWSKIANVSAMTNSAAFAYATKSVKLKGFL
jgi:hypothetical protein